MSLILGARGIGDWSTPDERPKSYHETLFKLLQDVAPLFNLMSKIPDETVNDMEFAVFNEPLVPNSAVISGAHNNSVTTINLQGTAQGKSMRAGDVIRCRRTDELMRISTDPTTPWNSVTVDTRGNWGGGAASMVDGDIVDIMSPPGVEKDVAPSAVSDTPSVVWNYLQDTEECCELSDWARDTEIRPANEKAWAREKRRAAERFKLKWEKALYYSKKVSTTVNGQLAYMTGGLNYWIQTNAFDDTSTGTSLDHVLDIFAQLRSYNQGSDTKWGFAGAGAITRLTNLIRKSTMSNFTMTDPLDKRGTWGMKVINLEGPTMSLQLIQSGVLSMMDSNRVFILDPKYLKLARKNGAIGAVKYEDDIKKDNGYKGIKGRWRGVMGLMLGQEPVHGKWLVGDPLP